MSDIDAILYVDTDVIFLGAIEEIWDHFDKFDSWQVGALAPRVGWNFKVRQENKNYVQMPNGQMTQINSGVSITFIGLLMYSKIDQINFRNCSHPWQVSENRRTSTKRNQLTSVLLRISIFDNGQNKSNIP